MDNASTGAIGENEAARFLKKKGFIVLHRNYRLPGGEIDIIARAPDRTLVFVEVKTMMPSSQGLVPEDQMTSAKRNKMMRAAQLFVQSNAKLIDEAKGWRIDAIAIVLGDRVEIRHYENV